MISNLGDPGGLVMYQSGVWGAIVGTRDVRTWRTREILTWGSGDKRCIRTNLGD